MRPSVGLGHRIDDASRAERGCGARSAKGTRPSHRSIIGAVLTLPGPLVTVDWLRANRSDPALRIADVRWSLAGPPGRDLYAAGHLPGAVFIDLEHELSSPGEGPGRHPLPSASKLATVLGQRGIGDEHLVVAYDDAGGSVASRLWWLYRHFGHAGRCAVLDGGIEAWRAAGEPLTTDAPSLAAATWTPDAARDDIVDADAVAAGELLLLDARAGERYRGETEPVDPRPGHIPGARSAPWSANLDAERRFLPAATLSERFGRLGARDDVVVAYCGSGVNATHDLLALELAGIRGARLYEGSWSDWSSDPRRPAALGARP